MANLIEKFTLGRGAYLKDALNSSKRAKETIDAVKRGEEHTEQFVRNNITDLQGVTGLFRGGSAAAEVTETAERFLRLYEENAEDAWRWLITRSLWLYIIPNGSGAHVNGVAEELGITSFGFFRFVLRVLTHLQAQPDEDRFLFYNEMMEVFSEDENWTSEPGVFAEKVLALRRAGNASVPEEKTLLKLEEKYGAGKDNWNGVFRKSLKQTGLFEYHPLDNRSDYGIALRTDLDEVLQGRVRFVIDHPVEWDGGTSEDWQDFLARTHDPDLPVKASLTQTSAVESSFSGDAAENLDALITDAHTALKEAGFRVEEELVRRYAASLLAKPFVILTGLSGSGKTKLAQLFASWISGGAESGDDRHELVAVGADWTGTEDVLGYPDALSEDRYVHTRALNLMLRAHENYEEDEQIVPYFLILDEMNLSHVERYFADFLSAIESGEQIALHGERSDAGESIELDGVPGKFSLPPNLFVVGTVNVDETTYMFSPKVLDRANAIEFRVSKDELGQFFSSPGPIKEEQVEGRGQKYAEIFAREAEKDRGLKEDERALLEEEALLFFDALRPHEMEFAFRPAKEMAHFVAYHWTLTEGEGHDFDAAMDAQVLQKLLPKLNGSRDRLEPVLCAMAVLCRENRPWHDGGSDGGEGPQDREALLSKAREASSLSNRDKYPLDENGDPKVPVEGAHYPASYDKIVRMLRRLDRDGFVSFAEA